MRALVSFEYAVIRVVPRVEREEFMNVGVILFSRPRRYLKVRIELDRARLAAFAPGCDGEEIARHLAAFERIAAGDPEAGPIAQLPFAERFHWLVAPRSTIIQSSPLHTGLAHDLDQALERLVARMVRLDG